MPELSIPSGDPAREAVPAPAAAGASPASRTRSDVLLNLVGNVVPLLAAFVCIPRLSAQLGPERFGFLTLLWALIGYAGLFDLGIGRALTYHASLATAPRATTTLAPTVKAGMQVVGATALLGFLATALASGPLTRLLLSQGSTLSHEARVALVITSVAIIPTTLGNGLRGVLEGLQEFRVVAWVKAVTGSAFFAVPAALTFLGTSSLVPVAVAFLGVRLAAFAWCRHLVVRSPRYVASREARPTSATRKELLSYGVWVMVSGIISPLMVYGDRFIISVVQGAEHVGLYAVLQEILGRSLVVAASFAGAIMPRLVILEGEALRGAYARYFSRLALVMAPLYVVVWLVAPPLAELWLGRDLAGEQHLFAIFSAALFVNSMAQLPYTFLHARNAPHLTARFHVAEFVVYVPACIAATHLYGTAGAAIVWLGRVALDLGLLQWAARTRRD